MRRVVVTGMGIVSSIGNNTQEVTASLREAKSGIAKADKYAELGFRCQVHGEPKLDWEHHAQYSDMPWETFLKTASDSPCAFRVTVTEDDYFIYAFEGKEKDWLCYKLSDPADFGYCWGYCRLDSPAGREIVQKMAEARRLGQVNKQGEVVGQLILELRYPPEGKKSNQVIIEKFVHDSWIIP